MEDQTSPLQLQSPAPYSSAARPQFSNPYAQWRSVFPPCSKSTSTAYLKTLADRNELVPYMDAAKKKRKAPA